MKRLYLVIFAGLLISCANKSNQINKQGERDSIVKVNNTVKVDSIVSEVKELTSHLASHSVRKTKVDKLSHYSHLRFSGRGFTTDTLTNWDNENALKIKSIELSGFDSIPLNFSKFKNVETLTIGYMDWDTVVINEVFPNLKKLNLFGKYLSLDNNPSWLKNIEVIHAEKSKIIGLKSFRQTPNLIEFKIGFSGFDHFPSDFNSLKRLKYFQTGAHTHGTIDLTKISVENMPCLKFVEFHSWRGNLSGIPKGIESVKTVKVHHTNLTKEEKAKLKRR